MSTRLFRISNYSKKSFDFKNIESDLMVTIPSGTIGNIQQDAIPWCDRESDFPRKHIRLRSEGLTYSIWQQGDTIRCVKGERWVDNAPVIRGNAGINQSVTWNIDDKGSPVQLVLGGITGLHYITNNSNDKLEFVNHKDPRNNKSIPPYHTIGVGNAWIPECFNEDMFPKNHMTLFSENGNVKFCLWQIDTGIYFSTNGEWLLDANKIGGNNSPGQSVTWTFSKEAGLMQSRFL